MDWTAYYGLNRLRAKGLVVAGLRPPAWSEAALRVKPKAHPAKLALARELRSRTTMPPGWVEARLRMGIRGRLGWLLSRSGRRTSAAPTGRGVLEV